MSDTLSLVVQYQQFDKSYQLSTSLSCQHCWNATNSVATELSPMVHVSSLVLVNCDHEDYVYLSWSL